jgi:hypothetical protein
MTTFVEKVSVWMLVGVFILTCVVGVCLNLFIDETKTGRLKRRSIFLFGPFVPEEILTPKGLLLMRVRNLLVVIWLTMLVVVGIAMSIRKGG